MLTEENKQNLEEIENMDESASATVEQSDPASFFNKDSGNSEELSKLNSQLVEQKDKFLRLYAEFENYKKRTAKERIDLIKTAGQDIIVELIGVLDDFDRAQKISIETENTNVYPEGMGLLHHKLLTLLQNRGLSSMNSTGTNFDPELHEAIAEIPAQEEELRGKIVDTVEKGYVLSDKIIRFAKVVVGK